MAARLLEVHLPATHRAAVEAIIAQHAVVASWYCAISDTAGISSIVLPAEATEALLDALEAHFGDVEDFRLLLLPVEATLPHLPAPAAPSEPAPPAGPQGESPPRRHVSREELYTDVSAMTELTWDFVAMVLLSTVVAAIGLVQSRVAVVIGAMVIAPLLGPNMGLALATTLADVRLGRAALKTGLVGLLVALSLAVVLGAFLSINPATPEIRAQTTVSLTDISIALAAGCAGALAFTTGVSVILIGVMVAVALLPPVVTLGLLLGAGFPHRALATLLLLLSNIICINLAGVVTFLVQGIHPRTWWEADRARKASWIAVGVWVLLLAALVAAIVLAHRH